MKFDQVRDQLFGSVSLNNVFFRDYLPSMDGDSVRLYIYLLYLSTNGLECTKEAIAAILNIDISVYEASMIKLQSLGLIIADENNVTVSNITTGAINKMYTLRTASVPVKETETAQNGKQEERADRIRLLKAISDSYFSGQMPGAWYTEVELWLDKYNFTPEVIFMLFQQCVNNNALTKPYARKIAENWGEAGIKTEEQLIAHLGQYDEYKKVYDYVGKSLKISPLTDFQKKFIDKWMKEYGYGQDIMALAFSECAGKYQRPTFNLYDKLMTEWHSKNLATVKDISEYNEKKKSGKTSDGSKDKSGTQKQNYSGRVYDEAFFDKLYEGDSGK